MTTVKNDYNEKNRNFVMSSIMIKCPHYEYEFRSPFQEIEKIRNVSTNCPKCANSLDIESNLT